MLTSHEEGKKTYKGEKQERLHNQTFKNRENDSGSQVGGYSYGDCAVLLIRKFLCPVRGKSGNQSIIF